MSESQRYQRLARLLKHGAWLYAASYLIVMGLFLKFHLYKLPYSTKASYLEKHKVAQYGLTRLHGNLASINAWWLVLFLAAGFILGLLIFYAGRQIHQPGFPGIILAVGALMPLLPPYSENVLARIMIATGFILFGAGLQWFINKTLITGPSPYKSSKPFFPEHQM